MDNEDYQMVSGKLTYIIELLKEILQEMKKNDGKAAS